MCVCAYVYVFECACACVFVCVELTAIVDMISGNDLPAAGVYVCVFICLYA